MSKHKTVHHPFKPRPYRYRRFHGLYIETCGVTLLFVASWFLFPKWRPEDRLSDGGHLPGLNARFSSALVEDDVEALRVQMVSPTVFAFSRESDYLWRVLNCKLVRMGGGVPLHPERPVDEEVQRLPIHHVSAVKLDAADIWATGSETLGPPQYAPVEIARPLADVSQIPIVSASDKRVRIPPAFYDSIPLLRGQVVRVHLTFNEQGRADSAVIESGLLSQLDLTSLEAHSMRLQGPANESAWITLRSR